MNINLLSVILNEDLKMVEQINCADIRIEFLKTDLILRLSNARYTADCLIDKEYLKVNIDTITRLMKEWCNKELNFRVNFSKSLNVVTMSFNDSLIFVGETEYDAVLKASKWIYENKG